MFRRIEVNYVTGICYRHFYALIGHVLLHIIYKKYTKYRNYSIYCNIQCMIVSIHLDSICL